MPQKMRMKRWIDACEKYGIASNQLSCFKELHTSYCDLYKITKGSYRKETGKNYGWEPDQEFLESLSPKQDSYDLLRKIALAIRRYETCSNTQHLADEDESISLKDIEYKYGQSVFDDK